METDEQKIYFALCMWANYIETGDIGISAVDAEDRGLKVKGLDLEQMKTVIRIRELASAALEGKIKIDS